MVCMNLNTICRGINEAGLVQGRVDLDPVSNLRTGVGLGSGASEASSG